MPSFAYKAMQRDGVLKEGLLDASNRHEAMRQVEVLGLKPIRLAESGSAGAGKAVNGAAPSGSAKPAAPTGGGFTFGQPRKITARMLENFTRLLSSLLAAGVPFSR